MGDGCAESTRGWRGNLCDLGEGKWEAWELGSSEGGALGDMGFMVPRQEVWQPWGSCPLRREV